MVASLLLLASAASVPIDVGRFDPADFPNAQKVERRMPHSYMNERIEKVLARGECQLPGQTAQRFDIDIPYAVLMGPTGAAQRVVVKDVGCPAIETWVGQIAIELAKAGDFKPSSKGERWYVSEAYFTRLPERETRELADLDKVVCRAAKPKLGSRIAKERMCLTVAQWKIYDSDREQLRRDLQVPNPISNE
jgi:hypothetical protein